MDIFDKVLKVSFLPSEVVLSLKVAISYNMTTYTVIQFSSPSSGLPLASFFHKLVLFNPSIFVPSYYFSENIKVMGRFEFHKFTVVMVS